ncbi:hemerythrin superfamily protein [Bradyrhizobium sp. USDA 4472]
MLGFFEKLLEYANRNPGEFLTGVATLLLVVATALLVRATNVLFESAKEDSRNRKIQATVGAWMKVRTELDLAHLSKESPEKELRAQLRALEAFSVGVNSGVYDLTTFKQMSGNWYCSAI